ncbi:MAG TPA: histone deacetylase [Thermoanaerobaculia bacterium]|nr:histone deacetylase [Thermoanaerobaculia bacterium]
MTTGLVFDERFLLHRAPYEHPEHPGRLTAIHARLEKEGLFKLCERVAARPAPDEELSAVHTREHIRAVDATAGREFTQIDPDTYAGPDSAAAARLAAGGLVDLTLAAWRGELSNGFALLRPPGHHAEASQAMGFCLFNNIAVAARAARSAGASRILIVDWDVHHGNGTQNTFWDDPSVLYFSTHQYPFYPGTGSLDETGGPSARGRNVNIPWPAGMGDPEYIEAFDRVLLPLARGFEPDLVLVSCGFDAAEGDLLGQMRLTPAGYAQMTRRLQTLAGGRLVLALEGGYNLDAIGRCAAACTRVLLGEDPDPVARARPRPEAERILDQAIQRHRPFWPGLSPST